MATHEEKLTVMKAVTASDVAAAYVHASMKGTGLAGAAQHVWEKIGKEGDAPDWFAQRISNRAVYLRQLGVELPLLPPGRKGIDVEEINRQIQEIVTDDG